MTVAGEGEAKGEVTPPAKPKPRPKSKRKKKRRKGKGKSMSVLKSGRPTRTLEEMLPPEPMRPRVIVKEGVKTARVKLKRDYWPSENVTLETHHDAPFKDRMLAGMVVDLPYDEVKIIVGRGIAEVVLE